MTCSPSYLPFVLATRELHQQQAERSTKQRGRHIRSGVSSSIILSRRCIELTSLLLRSHLLGDGAAARVQREMWSLPLFDPAVRRVVFCAGLAALLRSRCTCTTSSRALGPRTLLRTIYACLHALTHSTTPICRYHTLSQVPLASELAPSAFELVATLLRHGELRAGSGASDAAAAVVRTLAQRRSALLDWVCAALARAARDESATVATDSAMWAG